MAEYKCNNCPIGQSLSKAPNHSWDAFGDGILTFAQGGKLISCHYQQKNNRHCVSNTNLQNTKINNLPNYLFL